MDSLPLSPKDILRWWTCPTQPVAVFYRPRTIPWLLLDAAQLDSGVSLWPEIYVPGHYLVVKLGARK